jgi:hypothetical protein
VNGKKSTRYLICNLCGNKNELDKHGQTTKTEYYYQDWSEVEELNVPTIDFKFTNNNMKIKENYLTFALDISNYSYSLGFYQYVK